jgi:murein DD-endopeptidase MepM/ murein hydrolase activator NlpD
MSGIVVAPGQEVRKGEIIGFVGSSGYSTGPHVHFEVLVDGQTIDPMYMLNLGKETNK